MKHFSGKRYRPQTISATACATSAIHNVDIGHNVKQHQWAKKTAHRQQSSLIWHTSDYRHSFLVNVDMTNLSVFYVRSICNHDITDCYYASSIIASWYYNL